MAAGAGGLPATFGDAMSWADYWNGDTTLYVNARHRCVHYEAVARDLLAHLPGRGARVVDFGCGEALSAALLADACSRLYLCDSAPRLRARLAQRYAHRPDIAVIAPEEFERLPAGSIDMVIANSVVQYLSPAELGRLLATARDKLAGGGRLLLADVVPRRVGALTDAAELLKFAAANGFLLSAAAGLVRSFFSRYRRMRTRLGLLRFEEEEIVALLAEAGFRAHRLPRNVGHNGRRMTILAHAAETERVIDVASSERAAAHD